MRGAKRIAVVGLYNSGSTALAGMLHHLGVNMGPPFYLNSREGDENNFYESYQLSRYLRAFWSEPWLRERVSSPRRIDFLAQWVAMQEVTASGPVGAKHPLLSLCGPDLAAAWGPETLFIWSWRPFKESVAGLRRRGWFGWRAPAVQRRLWNALTKFQDAQPGMALLDWNQVKSKPQWAARQLAYLAGIDPTVKQLRAASELIRLPGTKAGDSVSLPPTITIPSGRSHQISSNPASFHAIEQIASESK